MVDIDPDDAVTNNKPAEMVQRKVQSQGRVDIPSDHLREVLGIDEGDSVHLIPDEDNGSIRIISSTRMLELAEAGEF